MAGNAAAAGAAAAVVVRAWLVLLSCIGSDAVTSIRVFGSGATTALPILPDFANHVNGRYKQRIKYTGTGSGAGRKQFMASAVLYVASDVPFTVQEEAQLAGYVKFTLPFALETITVFTSIPNAPNLKLDAPTISKIFQRLIVSWNDPAITRLNPTLSLPDKPIVPVVRKDSSGSTQLFSEFLHNLGKRTWKLGMGGLLKWPIGVTQVALTSGVAKALKSTPYAITYAGTGAGTALGLKEALVKNVAGWFLQASTATVQSAIPRNLPPSINSWASVTLIGGKGATTWPITSFLYVMARRNQYQNGRSGVILTAWLNFLFSDGVQPLMNKYDFTPVPPSVLSKNRAALATMMLIPGFPVPVYN